MEIQWLVCNKIQKTNIYFIKYLTMGVSFVLSCCRVKNIEKCKPVKFETKTEKKTNQDATFLLLSAKFFGIIMNLATNY